MTPDNGQPALSPPPLAPDNEQPFPLADYLHLLRRRWRLLALAAVLGLGLFGVRYSLTPKEYRATAEIQIERASLSSLAAGSNLSPWLNNWWNLEYYPTQYRLLQSRGLAERVVRNLRLWEDARFHPGGVSVVAEDRPATPSDDDAVVTGLAGKVVAGLGVNPIQKTQMVQISFRSRDPELSALIANEIVRAYIDWRTTTRTETVGQASSSLGEQIESIRTELEAKEAELQQYGQQEDIITLDPASNVVLQRLRTLDQQLLEAQRSVYEKEARYRELVNAPRESVADTLSEGVVSQLRREQIAREEEYNSKLGTFRPEYPAMKELKSRIDEGRQNLDRLVSETVDGAIQTARSSLAAARREEASVADEIDRVKLRNREQETAAIHYNSLEQEIQTRREQLNQLMRAQSQTEVASSLETEQSSNVRWVDRALVPGAPFRPSLRSDLSAGLLLGLAAGIGLILLIEFLDRSIKTPDEVERVLGLPVLAVIPSIDEAGRGYGYGYSARRKSSRKTTDGQGMPIELLPHLRPRLAISEAYRALRTAMLLSTADELRVIAVTSAEGGEGKTTTAANLAVVMAQLGRRVLLVDADLRKPRQHKVFRAPNRVGLVNYLTTGAEIEESFLRTEIPGLHLTPSGPTPPNPAELLSSARMQEFLRQVTAGFDFVIVDTPPVLAVTDSTVLGTLVDGVLITLRAHKIAREDAKACRNRLLQAGVKVLGTVFNRYAAHKGRYGRYDHYESYAESLSEATDSAA